MKITGGRICLVAVLLLSVLTTGILAQSSGGSFTITSQVAAGGGCAPNGSGGCTPSIGSGNLVVTGTAAEPGAADLSRQPPNSVRGGFWYATLGTAPTASSGMIRGTTVDDNGNPVAGVLIRLSGVQNRKTVTDANGNYSFLNVETNGFYTVMPARANYNFSPLNRSFSQTGNQTEAVFIAEGLGDTANPLDTAEFFVRQQYLDVLGREPEETGFNYWSDQILACGAEQRCVSARRRDVAAAFFIEQEAQQTGSYIYDVYAGALGRRPLFSEYQSDHQQVLGSMNLNAEKMAFAESFVLRAEFTAKYLANTTAESFVDALIQNVRNASGGSAIDLSNQRNALLGVYNDASNQPGATQNAGRAGVLRSIADNAVFKQSQYNQAFVLTEYFAYLNRDIDLAGYNFWVGLLNTGDEGNYRGMVCSFVTSTEYQKRFSRIVSHSNGECGN